ncbi:MAG: hypothetical protein ACHQUC_03505 [Chlamydiales bacterium]
MLTAYQPLVGDSLVTTSSFVQASLTALRIHKAALRIVEKDSNKAVNFLTNCAELARQMAEESDKLVKRAEAMCNQASEALIAATKDEVDTETARKAILKEIANLKATEAKLKQLTEDLTSDIAEAQAEERKAAKEAKDARNKAFIIGLLSAVSSCFVSAGLNLVQAGSESNPEIAIASRLLGFLRNQKKQIDDEKSAIEKALEEAKQKLKAKKEEKERRIRSLDFVQSRSSC